MDNTMALAGPALAGNRSLRLRAGAVIAALALLLAMFVVVQESLDAAPAGAAVAASVAAVGAGEAAQIDFNQIICSILISVRNAFANTPFGGFVTPILNQLIQGFGCAPS